jgi:hypothetical protein
MFGIFPPENYFSDKNLPHPKEYKSVLTLARLYFKG